MKFHIKEPKNNIITTFRRSGYSFQRYEKDEASFVRVLGLGGYPRFHIYASEKDKGIDVNIHFDTQKFTYGQNSARHHAEYENEGLLKEEVERIIQITGGLI